MNHNEAEELDSNDGDPDRPEEIGNQSGPPLVECLHCTTSTDQRTQGGDGCSKPDVSFCRTTPFANRNDIALAMRRRYRERRGLLTSVIRTPAHTNESTANAASMARIQRAKSRVSVLGGMTGLLQPSRTPVP